jgi:putative glutathione S-transferase
MMAELAPQDKTGSYQRPKYNFAKTIGSKQLPAQAGRYHVYVGNPCPVSADIHSNGIVNS